MNSSDDLARGGVELAGQRGQDRVDEADAHEGDDAGEGDGPDGLGLLGQVVIVSFDQLVQHGQRGGERLALVRVERGSRASSSGGARVAHRVQPLAALGGDGDEHGARVAGVGAALDEPVALEPADERGHRRLRDAPRRRRAR